MSDTVFRLMERHQLLDVLLRRAQSRSLPDALEILRLISLILAIRSRLSRVMGRHHPKLAVC